VTKRKEKFGDLEAGDLITNKHDKSFWLILSKEPFTTPEYQHYYLFRVLSLKHITTMKASWIGDEELWDNFTVESPE